MKTKAFWQSSTLWINFIGLTALGLDIALKGNFIADPDIVALLLALANIVNRLRSIQPPVKLNWK